MCLPGSWQLWNFDFRICPEKWNPITKKKGPYEILGYRLWYVLLRRPVCSSVFFSEVTKTPCTVLCGYSTPVSSSPIVLLRNETCHTSSATASDIIYENHHGGKCVRFRMWFFERIPLCIENIMHVKKSRYRTMRFEK